MVIFGTIQNRRYYILHFFFTSIKLHLTYLCKCSILQYDQNILISICQKCKSWPKKPMVALALALYPQGFGLQCVLICWALGQRIHITHLLVLSLSMCWEVPSRCSPLALMTCLCPCLVLAAFLMAREFFISGSHGQNSIYQELLFSTLVLGQHCNYNWMSSSSSIPRHSSAVHTHC